MADGIQYRDDPLRFIADGLRVHALEVWELAVRLSLNRLAQRPISDVAKGDAEVHEVVGTLSDLSERLFELRKALSGRWRQVVAQPLPEPIATLLDDAIEIVRTSAHLSLYAASASAARVATDESYPEHQAILEDVRRVAEALHGAREAIANVRAATDDPEAVIRWQTAVAAQRLNLSMDDARDRVTRRWRDP